eukprot:scaffold155380_cov60-Cyclotella_meneghiniana.AAC.1
MSRCRHGSSSSVHLQSPIDWARRGWAASGELWAPFTNYPQALKVPKKLSGSRTDLRARVERNGSSAPFQRSVAAIFQNR